MQTPPSMRIEPMKRHLAPALFAQGEGGKPAPALSFDLKSVRSGAWSEAVTWDAGRVPGTGERVLASRAASLAIRQPHTVHAAIIGVHNP